MRIVTIGSVALAQYIRLRTPRDLDIVGTYDDLVEYIQKFYKPKTLIPIEEGTKLLAKTDIQIIEGDIAWAGSSSEMLLSLVEPVRDYAPLDLLYTIKMSHRFKKNSPHFRKTMDDILAMRKLGAKIRPEYEEFYKKRQEESYNYAHPKLNVSKGDFFKGDGVQYVYDHDSIHEAIAKQKRPAYRNYIIEGEDVLCSKDKFMACSERIKLFGVLEEAYVLALERSQIPFKGKITPRQSFEIALMKVCTSITSGWFREYAWENYYRVKALYTDYYVEKFWNAVASGKVKPHV